VNVNPLASSATSGFIAAAYLSSCTVGNTAKQQQQPWLSGAAGQSGSSQQ